MLNRGYGHWIAAGCLGAAAPSGLAQTCDDNSGNSPYVCVDWSQAQDPEKGSNFTFNFSDPDNPDVELWDGDSGWVVWSQVSSSNSTPANLGVVTIDPSSNSENFQVKIINGGSAGAANVGKIDLTKSTDWTGYSALTGGSITGNLTGDIDIYKIAAGGITITGDMAGDITINTIAGGDMTGDITADSIAAGGLTICGDMVGDIDINTIAAGNLTIEGDYGDGINISALTVDTLDSAIVQIGEEGVIVGWIVFNPPLPATGRP